MKNLKKVLALVLAFACAFTMFAGAAFTDAADISQTEAVDMLTALGVIDGYDDGSFRPEATVTRAEMAKMIYTIRTGSSDASAYNNDATTFTDINGHWARGYIKYCQSLGIIAGKSTTSFDPDATVTTQEAAKMLLVTLGYNAEKAGLEGATWGAKTTALADENGLLKDVNNGTTQGLPRQYAAQLMYNAIFANTVTLRDGEYTKYGYNNSLNPTIGEKYMDLYKTEAGVLYKCELVDGKDYYTITTSGYVNSDGDRVNTTFNKVPTDISSMIGQEIVVLRKVNASDETVYGVYTDEDSKVVATGYASQLEKDGDKIKLNGASYKTSKEHDVNSIYNINHDTAASNNMDALFTAADKGTVNAATAATEIKLIDNDGDGKVDLSVQTPAAVAKVTAVSKTAINVRNLDTNAVSTIKFEDADVYEGVAKDDYVTIIDADNRSNDKDLVTKMDVVSAQAEATRSTTEVRVDGTWYKLAKVNDGVIAVTTGNSYNFVMVGGVVVVADETAASASSIAYISDIEKDATDDTNKLETSLGETTGTVKVRMFFQDGTDKEVKVSKIDGKKIKSAAGGDYAGKDSLTARTMYTYAELSDGTYDVKVVNGSNDVGMDFANTTFPSGLSTVYNKQKISSTSVADDAVVFVQTNDETKVVTGKQISNWGETVDVNFVGNTQMLTKDTNGIKYVKYAVLSCTTAGKVPGATEDRSYAYLLSNPSQETVDGEKKGAYEVWTGTETTTLHVDASKATKGAAGDVISYATNGKFIEDIKVVGHKDDSGLSASTGMSFILGVDGGNLRFIGNDGKEATYEFSDDCKFIAINADKTEGAADIEASMSNISYPATEVVVGDKTYYVPNAYVVYDPADSNKIVAVIYDADDGKLNVPTDAITYLVEKK